MKRIHLGLSVLIVYVSSVSPLYAETWKCTLENGETQYTAVPVSNADCKPMHVQRRTQPPPPTRETAVSGSQRASKAASNAQPRSEQDTDRNQDIARINSENCERAKANLHLLSSSTRIRLKEGDEYRVIPEEERREKMDLAQEQIDTYCQ